MKKTYIVISQHRMEEECETLEKARKEAKMLKDVTSRTGIHIIERESKDKEIS